MEKFDVNGLFGTWPFRRFYHGGMNGLYDIHKRNGITGGAVSSLQSIFYNDPMEAEEVLADALTGTPYFHVMGVNPTLPATQLSIAEAVARFHIRAVRIYPGYHQYSLDHPCMKQLHSTLLHYNLPLLVSVRMEDVRVNYLAQPRTVEINELKALASAFSDIKLLYMSVQTYEVCKIADVLRYADNAFVETSFFKSPTHPFESALRALPPDKLLYGSAYPMNCLKSTLIALEEGEVSVEARNKILYTNALRFFG